MNILEHETEGKFYHEYNNCNTTSSIVSSSSSSVSSSGGSRSTQDEDTLLSSDIKQEYVLPSTPPSPRMESGGCDGTGGSNNTSGNSNNESVSNPTNKPELESFSCEKCGKSAYRNSAAFGTIQLGDIFSNYEDSSGKRNDEGPPQQRLCAQCLDSHISGGEDNGSTTHINNVSNNSGSVTDKVCNSNSGHTALVTNCLPNSDNNNKELFQHEHGGASNNEDESTAALLQGVPSTIIMQNAANTTQLHQSEMHQDHQQQQNYYHQQDQQILEQVKLETDTMGHSQPHDLDNFMLIHGGAGDGSNMFPDNNELISFQRQQEQQQSDNQYQQQVISPDNQSITAASGIQQMVASSGSDIKYTIPTPAIMQMQGKEQQSQVGDHLIGFPSTAENHLISLSDGSVISSGTGGDIVPSVPSTTAAPPTSAFQFMDLVSLNKDSTLFPSSATPVVTKTEASTTSASSIMTFSTMASLVNLPPPPPVLIPPVKKERKPKKEKNAASGSGASKSKNNNNNNNLAVTTDKKNAQNNKGQGKEQAEKTPCDLCKKKFKNPKMAIAHYRRVHQKEARFVCDCCGAVFSYRSSLDAHLEIHKKEQEKSHDCGKCGMQFSLKANLRQHMRIHSDNPKKFPCDFCPSGFSKRVNLRYHIKRKHPEEAEKMNNNNNSNKDSTSGGGVGCGPVGNNFLQAGLAGPITPTNSSNPAGVDGGGVDNSKGNKNEGNFKCEHCDRSFLFKNNLKAHLRTHTRDKKYTCELCTKSFIYKESLKNHMLLHSNELPYLCEVCGKKFRDRSNRRKHVKNVHKYLFVNGDINNPVKPGAPLTAAASSAAAATSGVASSSQGGTSTSQTGEPPTKKRKNSKKAAATATSIQLESTDETGLDGNSTKTRPATKSSGAPRGKKAKTAAASAAGSSDNMKSVIVNASTTSATAIGLDRKIIMSPSPKNPKSHSSSGISSGSVSSPNSLEYVHSHPSSLPVTVHVSSLAGSQGQFSHGRNIIVKASSTGTAMPPNHHQSPPALSPEMYHSQQQHHQQQQHGRGGHPPRSLQQNVIVYPKTEVIPDHSQQYTSSVPSVISQTMQQQQQQQQPQYYSMNPSPEQHHHTQHHRHQTYGYVQLQSQQPSPVQSSLMHNNPHPIPSPNPTGFDYGLGSTNHLSSQPAPSHQDQRGSDPYGGSAAHGSAPQQQPMEIQVVNPEYSHHLYASDLYEHHQQYHQWQAAAAAAATSGQPPGMDGTGHGHPPNSSSPYQQLVVAPPVGSSGSSSSILVNEGPPGSHLQHPSHHPSSVSLAQSYHHDSSGGLNPNSNALNPAAVYATGTVQGHEVLDQTGNGGGYFYKDDFDFSYL